MSQTKAVCPNLVQILHWGRLKLKSPLLEWKFDQGGIKDGLELSGLKLLGFKLGGNEEGEDVYGTNPSIKKLELEELPFGC